MVDDSEKTLLGIGRLLQGAVASMIFRDKYGWPVERIIGKPITNLVRLLLHTNIKQTLRAKPASEIDKPAGKGEYDGR
jgi:hypothetical protein